MRHLLPTLLLSCLLLPGLSTGLSAALPERKLAPLTPLQGGRPLIESFADARITEGHPFWAVTRSPAGELAVGGNAVHLFDGIRWTRVEVPACSAVRSLSYDSANRLWLAGTNTLGYVERSPQGIPVFHSMKELPGAEKLPSLGDIWEVLLTKDGRVIWVGDDQVLSWDGARLSCWTLDGPLRLLGFLFEGEVLVQERSLGLFRITPQGPLLLKTAAELPASTPSGIIGIERYQGTAYLICSLGILPMDAPPPAADAPVGELGRLLHQKALCYYARIGDLLYISTTTKGVVIADFTGRVLRTIDSSDGLPSQSVIRLFTDSHRTLWLSTSSRLLTMPLSPRLSLFDRKDGILGPVISIIPEDGGALHLLTENGLFRALESEGSPTLRFAPIPSLQGELFDARLVSKRRILLGKRGALFTWENQRTTTVFEDRVSSFNRLFPSTQTPDRLYASRNIALMVSRLAEDNRVVEEATLDVSDWPSSLVELDNHRILVGVYGVGVRMFQEDPASRSWTAIPLQTAMGGKLGRTFVVRLGAKALLLSRGALHAFESPNRMRRLDFPLPQGDPAAFASNADGNELWVAWQSGGTGASPTTELGYLSDSPEGLRWHPLLEPGIKKLTSLKAMAFSALEGRETLLVGSAEGLLCIDAATARQQLLKPEVSLVEMAAGTSTLHLGYKHEAQVPDLPFDASPLLIRFACLDPRLQSSVEYQSRLEGLDKDWTAASAITTRELGRLSEGRYTFEVRPVSAGVTGAPAVLRFTVLPPWYRSLPAYAAWLALGVLAVLATIRVRTRVIRQRNLELVEQVKLRTAQLEKANAAKSDFVAGISHEIRNPLNGIVGLTGILSQRGLPPDSARDVQKLRLSVQHLASLVEDVLDFAKIEAGTISFEPEPVSPLEILESARAVMEAQLSDAGMRLTLRTAPGLPLVALLDARKIRQVLINFITNALKYARKGTVTLALSMETEPRGKPWLRFSVADEGPGVPEEERVRIFDRFVRGRDASHSGVSGAGLGLAVCRSLAECMSAKIGLEAPPEGGACFFLSVPADPPEPLRGSASPFPRKASVGVAAARPRVLMVDDIAANLDVLEHFLRHWNPDTVRASDGEAALARLAERDFDLVLLDLGLPGISGVEVVKRYRAAPRPGGAIPLFVATTAYATRDMRNACLEAGFSSFLAKPVSETALRAIVEGTTATTPDAPSFQASSPARPPSPLEAMAAGDPARLRSLQADCLQDLDTDLDRLSGAVARGDLPGARGHAHRIISHGALLGEDAIRSAAGALQDAADRGDASGLRPALAALQAAVETFRERWNRVGA